MTVAARVAGARSRNHRRAATATAWLLLAAAAVAAPVVVPGRFWLYLADMVLINSLLGLGLNVILKSGQISLAHAAFVGLGAYTSAQLTMTLHWPFIAALASAGLVSGLLALLLGLVILRLSGVYFLLFTFAFGEFSFLVFKQAGDLTGGNTGLYGIPPARLPFIEQPLRTPGAFYGLALAVLFAALWMLHRLYRSNFGRQLDAVRENEELAESTGIASARVKLLAFGLGSALAGLGGSLFAHFVLYISPFHFTFTDSVKFLLINIIGGSTSILGPLVGAALITPLPELLQNYLVWQQVLYGIILILAMRFAPEGLAPLFARSLRKWIGRS